MHGGAPNKVEIEIEHGNLCIDDVAGVQTLTSANLQCVCHFTLAHCDITAKHMHIKGDVLSCPQFHFGRRNTRAKTTTTTVATWQQQQHEIFNATNTIFSTPIKGEVRKMVRQTQMEM